jgi:hypothetical protein
MARKELLLPSTWKQTKSTMKGGAGVYWEEDPLSENMYNLYLDTTTGKYVTPEKFQEIMLEPELQKQRETQKIEDEKTAAAKTAQDLLDQTKRDQEIEKQKLAGQLAERASSVEAGQLKIDSALSKMQEQTGQIRTNVSNLQQSIQAQLQALPGSVAPGSVLRTKSPFEEEAEKITNTLREQMIAAGNLDEEGQKEILGAIENEYARRGMSGSKGAIVAKALAKKAIGEQLTDIEQKAFLSGIEYKTSEEERIFNQRTTLNNQIMELQGILGNLGAQSLNAETMAAQMNMDKERFLSDLGFKEADFARMQRADQAELASNINTINLQWTTLMSNIKAQNDTLEQRRIEAQQQYQIAQQQLAASKKSWWDKLGGIAGTILASTLGGGAGVAKTVATKAAVGQLSTPIFSQSNYGINYDTISGTDTKLNLGF